MNFKSVKLSSLAENLMGDDDEKIVKLSQDKATPPTKKKNKARNKQKI